MSHGRGKFVSGDKMTIYEGEFRNDVQHGHGKEIKIG